MNSLYVRLLYLHICIVDLQQESSTSGLSAMNYPPTLESIRSLYHTPAQSPPPQSSSDSDEESLYLTPAQSPPLSPTHTGAMPRQERRRKAMKTMKRKPKSKKIVFIMANSPNE